MTVLMRLAAYLRNLLTRRRASLEHDDELQFHIEQETAANIARGMSAAEARRVALRDLGGVTQTREAVRDVRATWMDMVWRDVRHAVRATIWGAPAYTAITVLVLGAGIGLATATFSVLDAVLWHRVPFRDAARLVEIHNFLPAERMIVQGLSREQTLGWRRQTDLFDRVEAYGPRSVVYQSANGPEVVSSATVTPGMFELLGVQAALGRTFTEVEGRAGADRRVVLADAFWRERLGADPSVIGRIVTLDGAPYDVVGVMPSSFIFPERNVGVWLPIDAEAPPSNDVARTGAAATFPTLVPVARLVAGVGLARADERVRARGESLNESLGVPQPRSAAVLPFGREADDDVARRLVMLGGAVGFLLLIVCVNVASLRLSRALARSRMRAIQVALGASRAALVREAVAESLVVGLAGVVAGVAVAAGALHLIRGVLPAMVTRSSFNVIDIDGRVLLFAVAAGLLSGIVCGLPSVWSACRPSVVAALHRERTAVAGSRSTHRLRAGLVIAEVGLSMVLLTGVALMARSLVALASVERGMDTRNLWALRVSLRPGGPVDAASLDRLAAETTTLLRRMGGVTGVTTGGVPTQTSKLVFGPVEIEGQTGTARVARDPLYEVPPEFFATLGIAMRHGRTFSDADPVEPVVVSETFARRYWPDGAAVSQRFRVDDGDWWTVVGVVADVRRPSVRPVNAAQVYHRAGATYRGGVAIGVQSGAALSAMRTVLVRTDGTVLSRERLDTAIRGIDRRAVLQRLEAVEPILSGDTEQPRLVFVVMSAFAMVALVIAAAGLYGVLSHMVEQRRREIGVRLALGATAVDVARQVGLQACAVTAVGLVLGVCASAALAGVMRAELYDVQPWDPVAFGAVGLAIGVVAAFAAWRPTVRAMRVDPAALMRDE